MNFHQLAALRNQVIADAAQVTLTTPLEDRVSALLRIHKAVVTALAGEGVLLPCHETKEES